MIKEQDLLEAIAECQGERSPNATTCRNLAAFYTILDHVRGAEPQVSSYQMSHDVQMDMTYKSGSEFSNTIQGKQMEDVLSVMDELMEALQVLHPKLYENCLDKLNSL